MKRVISKLRPVFSWLHYSVSTLPNLRENWARRKRKEAFVHGRGHRLGNRQTKVWFGKSNMCCRGCFDGDVCVGVQRASGSLIGEL